MRRLSLLLPLFVLVGCAPPEPTVGGAIGVTLISPVETEIELDDDGMIRFSAAVDVDGFEFRPPGEGEDGNETQGHWHLYINGEYKGPMATQSAEIEEPAEVGDNFVVQAVLATNDHNEIFIDGQLVQDTVEFAVVAGTDTQ